MHLSLVREVNARRKSARKLDRSALHGAMASYVPTILNATPKTAIKDIARARIHAIRELSPVNDAMVSLAARTQIANLVSVSQGHVPLNRNVKHQFQEIQTNARA